MSLKNFCILIALLISFLGVSQDQYYSSLTLPEALTEHANAVVRLSEVSVEIKTIDHMVEQERRIVTVLNSKGQNAVGARVYYDDDVKVRSVQAIIFDAFGNEIKKIRKNDFKDVSAVDGGTLYSDSRILYLDYTPISYPYTVEFISETTTSNTAFIPSFIPVWSYFVSVENSRYKINYPDDITLRKNEKNLEDVDFESTNYENWKQVYNIKNIKPFKPEDHSPSFRNVIPKVMFATNEFNYEGVQAEVDDWNSMGEWFNNNLLNGRASVSPETINHVKSLVANETDDLEKAKKIYQFVQDNTRYISVQVGIGGMRPISAMEVDKVKYGDCKGLTNYTKALLDLVGVKSYYTRLYASPSQQLSVDKDFVSFGGQTNHVILNIPQENSEDVWLECTSQDMPFGFIGDFTDDRDVLVITPEGGKIKHTKKYKTEENTQVLKGSYSLSKDGNITGELEMCSKGIQYDDKYRIGNYEERDKDMAYKKRWSYINSIAFDDIKTINDKDSIQFKEIIKFRANNYSKKAGSRILFTINALNRSRYIPDRYRNRTLPVKIKRGFIDADEIRVKLPSGYKVESLPKSTVVENKFGSYKTDIIAESDTVLVYKREFIVKDGSYPKEDYSAFRAFYKEVSKLDNAKVALVKISNHEN
ncbi:DUF3857 domain-containing protein [Hyunsoonleella flava]|uniref:DUF3857 domain-containing protein n=1 Tax=Hyunsoonleella flava TaxID=2527939 RepID=A0A4Q9FCF2_9FLAO|nr:DUF3857 domain-containing protein [Hyunsoonleella flava]TBN02676.1 DUF3857 domain-containing protein [Hyunsoonleella flava]